MDSSSDQRLALLPASERVWLVFLAALDELPADARAVLLLHDAMGAGIGDIASLLGLDASVCLQRLEQARACLQAHGDHLEPGAP